jgi:hypothetical protein
MQFDTKIAVVLRDDLAVSKTVDKIVDRLRFQI